MTNHRGLHRIIAIVLAACAAVVPGCQSRGVGTEGPSPGVTPQSGGECVQFEGSSHCALGDAELALTGDGALAASNLADAASDGVAISLPEVTSFSAEGRAAAGSRPLRLLARSINGEVSTSTMTVEETPDLSGVVISATFTGVGQDSSYSANLYQGGALVGVISGLGNGHPLENQNGPCPYQVGTMNWYLWCRHGNPPHFRVVQPGGNDPGQSPGACVWRWAVGGSGLETTLPDGTAVLYDEIELVEDVPQAGSYPYLSFNRIDYLADGGTLVLESETFE